MALALAALFVCSCETTTTKQEASYPGRTYRDPVVMQQAKQSKKKIVVYLDTQTGEFYADGKKGMTFPVSTGIPGHRTPSGRFAIFNKEKNNTSSLYGTIYNAKGEVVVPYANTQKDRVPPGGYYLGAQMPYTMKFTELCAFHEGIVPEEPTLTSHGCIHLTPDVARELFELCGEGTKVDIHDQTPEA